MSIFVENNIILLLPEIFLSILCLSLILYGVFVEANEGKGLIRNMVFLSIISLVCTFLLVILEPAIPSIGLFQGIVSGDELTRFGKELVLIGSIATLLIGERAFEENKHFEYIILFLFSIASMLVMISSYNLLTLYMTIEVQSLCFYVLAASKNENEFSVEAGIKYFLLGVLASGILLLGFTFLYGLTGTINMGEMNILFTGYNNSNELTFAIVLIAIALLFKISAAPFHMWAPDVYEGAPLVITAFFSIVPKVAYLVLFLRFLVSTCYEIDWISVVLFSSAISMVIGSFAALSQKKIKRMLAFSSVGHIGYILMGACTGSIEGMQSMLLYLVTYVITTICLFSILLALRNSFGSIHYIHDFSGLAYKNPLLAIATALCLFSLAGIPPLAGFVSKFFLFFSAMSSSLYVLAFLGVLTSCVSCFYAIRIIKIMYFEKPNNLVDLSYGFTQSQAIVLGASLFFIVFFFFYPEPLFLWTHDIALNLID